MVSGKKYLQEEYQRNLPLLTPMSDNQTQSLNTNRPSVNSLDDLLGEKLIPLNYVLEF